MSITAMPAYRPTASCIWNSFQNSGKRHIILTGDRNSGKTTLLKKLFPYTVPGITTWAEPMCAVYLKDNLTDSVVRIGAYNDAKTGSKHRMTLLPDGFSGLGSTVLSQCIQSDSEWVSIDEIGYLETGVADYCELINQLFEKKRVSAVVRKQPLPFLEGLCRRDDAFLIDLDKPFGNLGCVIMASGLGSRFGSNKLMADFLGKPLINNILDETDGIFAKRVVVTRHEDVADFCRERGVDVILHTLPHRSDTVRLGLEFMDGIDGCMFCPADQPLLRRETVASLALAYVNNSEFIHRPDFEDTPGAPVIFPKWAFPELLTLPEGKGGGLVINRYPERLRTISAHNLYELRDIDAPEDLQELLSEASTLSLY